MAKRDVVVVGASAGGVEALRTLAAGLPPDFPATVLVVLHTPATARSALPQILGRAGPLPAHAAVEGDRLEHGVVLVAPSDRHLLVHADGVTLSRGPRENGHRPAVDVLFRSAARAFGSRVVAVVLSGTLDDGAAGMVAVRTAGGVGVVQDPADAPYAGMPRAALDGDSPAHVLPVARIPELLDRLVREDAPRTGARPPALMTEEVAVAGMDAEELNRPDRPGSPSGFACPDCHGVLFEIEDGGLERFRCRVGHAWSPRSLAAQQTSAVEGALWTALRALEEKAALADRMQAGARRRGHTMTAESFARHATDARESAVILKDLLERPTDLVPDDGELAPDDGVHAPAHEGHGATGAD